MPSTRTTPDKENENPNDSQQEGPPRVKRKVDEIKSSKYVMKKVLLTIPELLMRTHQRSSGTEEK
jgi:hypothetical protein